MTDWPQLLTVRETAEMLRRHPETVRAMIARGEISALKIGNAWRIDAASLPAPTAHVASAPESPARRVRQPRGDLFDRIAARRAGQVGAS